MAAPSSRRTTRNVEELTTMSLKRLFMKSLRRLSGDSAIVTDGPRRDLYCGLFNLDAKAGLSVADQLCPSSPSVSADSAISSAAEEYSLRARIAAPDPKPAYRSFR